MIGALLGAKELEGRDLNDVASFTLRTNPRWLRVCDIKRPRTGLEVKFSYNWLAGMAMRGDRTVDDRTYTDALTNDAELAVFADRIRVTGDDAVTDLQAIGIVTLKGGTEIVVSHDLTEPLPDDILAEKLREKSVAAIGETGQTIWNTLSRLATMSARDLGELLRRAG